MNERVFANLPVRIFETPIEEARKLGAQMLFTEKYGDIVRVVDIDGWSIELCGGTHVRSTAEIGSFAILSEASVGAGSRRIEAVTSGEAYALLHERARETDELRAEVGALRKETKKRPAKVEAAELEARSEAEVGGVNIYVGRIGNVDMDVLLGSVDDGRAYLVVNLDQRVVEKGADAVSIVREAAKKIDGGGGGKPTLAEAGGKNPAGLAEAYEIGRSEIASALRS